MTNNSEFIHMEMVHTLQTTCSTNLYDHYILPTLATRYAYLFQDEWNIEFSLSWEDVRDDWTGKNLVEAIDQLSTQIPWIEYGLKLLDVSTMKKGILKLLTLVEKIDLKQNNTEFMELYFYKMAKLRGKSANLIEPSEVNQLSVQLLDIQPSSSVYDCASRYGRTLVAAAHANNHISISGSAMNVEEFGISALNLFLSGMEPSQLHQKNILERLRNGPADDQKYDYVISHPPLGWKIDESIKTSYGLVRREGLLAYLVHVLESLVSDGKAILSVTNGILFQKAAAGEIRKNIIDQDLIDAVITLPAGIFMGTGLPITLLVMNKKKAPQRQGKIQLIDASSLGERRRGSVRLSSSDIERIINLYAEYTEDSKMCRILEISEIKDNDYCLLPGYYFKMEEAESIIGQVVVDRSAYEANSVTTPLNEVVQIYRGLNTASGTHAETVSAKVIQLADVQDGELLIDQISTHEIKGSTNMEEGRIQAGDVLITSRGIAMKVTVVPEFNDGPYYLSANFIGLRPKPEVNPYYLAAFFESLISESYIRSLRKGSALPVLNVKDIQSIPIPQASSEQMKLIGDRYDQVNHNYTKAIQHANQERVSQLEDLYCQIGINSGYSRKN